MSTDSNEQPVISQPLRATIRYGLSSDRASEVLTEVQRRFENEANKSMIASFGSIAISGGFDRADPEIANQPVSELSNTNLALALLDESDNGMQISFGPKDDPLAEAIDNDPQVIEAMQQVIEATQRVTKSKNTSSDEIIPSRRVYSAHRMRALGLAINIYLKTQAVNKEELTEPPSGEILDNFSVAS